MESVVRGGLYLAEGEYLCRLCRVFVALRMDCDQFDKALMDSRAIVTGSVILAAVIQNHRFANINIFAPYSADYSAVEDMLIRECNSRNNCMKAYKNITQVHHAYAFCSHVKETET